MEFYYVFQSYFVYLSILAVIYFCCKEAIRKQKFSIIFIGLVFYALIFGLRYGVGRDCISYISTYDEVCMGYVDNRLELGYTFLMQIFAWMGAPSWIFMGFVALIQISAIFLFLKNRMELSPYISISFMLGCVWLSYCNGMRQAIALSIFIWSLHFLENRRLFLHYLLVLLAILFHKSAIILLLMYPAYYVLSRKTISRKLQFVLFAVSVVLGRIDILIQLMDYFTKGAILLGYDVYLEEQYSKNVLMEQGVLGIGYYIAVILCLVIIYYSRLITRKEGIFTYIYNLYLIGVMIKYIFIGSSLVQRLNWYFCGFDFIVAALLLYSLKTNGYKKGYSVLLGLLALTLVGTLYRMFDNTSAFYFIWQIDDYLRYSR